MRRTVMVLAAVLALMFGGASVAVGAEHNERPDHNENPPCENPGAAGEQNPHCPEGPPYLFVVTDPADQIEGG